MPFKISRQSTQFVVFLLIVAAGMSLLYRLTNRDWIRLAEARSMAKAGRLAEALPIYRSLAMKGFESHIVCKEMADFCFSNNMPREGREALLMLLPLTGGTDPDLLKRLAASALWLKLYTEAATEYSKVLQMEPSDRAARLGLARAFAWGGKCEEAVREYRKLLGD